MLKTQHPVDYLKRGLANPEANKQTEERQFERSVDNLGLPENFEVGQAVADGNCFFDSFRQGLEQQLRIVVTVEQLRKDCKEFAQNSPSEWFIGAITNSHNSDGTVRSETPDIYVREILNSNRWGDPEVEGRMLCQKYNVRLHVIEKHSLVKGEWAHQTVDATGSKSISSINYDEKNTIHIINSGSSHFEPLLNSLARQLPTQCQQEEASGTSQDLVLAGAFQEQKDFELARKFQEQEDFELAKDLQIKEILKFLQIQENSQLAAQVQGVFNKLLETKANCKITNVVKQCIDCFAVPSCRMEEVKLTHCTQMLVQPV